MSHADATVAIPYYTSTNTSTNLRIASLGSRERLETRITDEDHVANRNSQRVAARAVQTDNNQLFYETPLPAFCNAAGVSPPSFSQRPIAISSAAPALPSTPTGEPPNRSSGMEFHNSMAR